MRVGIVDSTVAPCQLYRAAGPASALREDLELVKLPEELRVRYTNRKPTQACGIKNLPDLDVIVFVRGVLPSRVVEWIPLIQRQGIAVCVDIDDDYERLPPTLLSLYKINPTLNPLYNWANVKKACRMADLVTVSTPALERYSADSIILRNCIPDHYLDIGRNAEFLRDGLTVGWGVTVYGHPGDLRVPKSGVAEALRATGGHFLNVGDGVDVKQDLSLDEEPEATEIVPLERYPVEMARLDVGIAPLVLDFYRREAKSALKPLESLSLGSAVVASKSNEYVRLRDMLADWCKTNDAPVPMALVEPRGRDWKRALVRALERSPEERHEEAEVARQFVYETHRMSQLAYQWGDAWEEAVRRRHASHLRAA